MDYDRLRELQQKFEENPRRYFAPLANEYRKGGQPRRAIEICRAQLEQMPGHMSGQIVYGQALYEAGEFVEAREVFERALTLDPENLIALRSLGDMSLQAGNTQEGRAWYSRLLDADPKDTAVIALISEIDAASDATPVAAEVPGIDTDVGDQQIPAGVQQAPDTEPIPEPRLLSTSEMPAFRAPSEQPPVPAENNTPLGLERHYPVAEPSGDSGAAQSAAPEGPTFEDLGVPPGGSATEGLTSAREDIHSALDSRAPESPELAATETALSPAAPRVEGLETTEFVAASQMSAAADFSEPPAVASESNDTSGESLGPPEGSNENDAGEHNWQDAVTASAEPEEESRPSSSAEAETAEAAANATAPAEAPDDRESEPAPAPSHRPAPTEERRVTAASNEPFVNETMAKLYLKQGYNQLALKVYRQLLVSRPNDQSLRDRILEIQQAEAAKHPEEAQVPREAVRQQEADRQEEAAPQAPLEEPTVERHPDPHIPDLPYIDTSTPDTASEPDDGFNFGRPAADSPPEYEPRRERESVEAPAQDEPRAEPAGIAARQPSIREFFATLGRRRPPRPSFAGTPRSAAQTHEAPSEPPSVDTAQSFGATPPAATLDSVFAGATVSAADARAASRLAGAFSGATGTSRTPPTPPMPTPRLNPRVQAQESEEDVAKFRAWLDGLTGE